MNDAGQTPTVYHCWVLLHVDAVVDRNILVGDLEGEVLGEPFLGYSFSCFREGVLEC